MTYLSKARNHVERIDYYFSHAGLAGYSQAHYHQVQLEELLQRAYRSQANKGDVPVIQALIESARPKMQEMKRRETEDTRQL